MVNIKLKRNFEGVDLRAGWSDSEKFKDALERNASGVWGGNFADRRGNAVIAFEYAEREGLIKSQRDFAAVATATTTFFPEGTYRPTANNTPYQAAVDALYGQASYGGSAPGTVPNTSVHAFNRNQFYRSSVDHLLGFRCELGVLEEFDAQNRFEQRV